MTTGLAVFGAIFVALVVLVWRLLWVPMARVLDEDDRCRR